MPLQANKQNHSDKKLTRRRHQKKKNTKKIQDISEEKGVPQTTKQTVTLTTVAGQKMQEKSLNGTYRLQRRNTKKNKSNHHPENLGVSNLPRSPLHLYYHDNHTEYTTKTTTSWLQTNQSSTSDYNRQFSNQCDRCKMLKVVHRNQSDNHGIWSDTAVHTTTVYIHYTVLQQY